MGGSIAFKSYLSLFHKAKAERFRSIFSVVADSFIHIHSVTPPLTEATGMTFENGVSYLLAGDGKGGWKTVRTWNRP